MTFIIAEAGVNHSGRLDRALALVAAAKTAGADAVKFQAFTPWKNAPLNYETQAMLKGLALTAPELEMLAAECRAKQIEFMVTPMDEQWLALVVSLGVKRIKIGSAQAIQKYGEFLPSVGRAGLPVIISNGFAMDHEIERALEHMNGCDVTLLYCVSKYPTPDVDINIGEIKRLRDKFGLPVGFSSHCRSFWPCVAAAYAGASVIEAHICLPGTTGVDVPSSLLPDEFQAMVREVRGVSAV